MRLKDKVALITGAGSGIGRAEAVLFAEEGAKVVVNDVSADDGKETVSLIKEKGGETCFFQANVSVASQVESMIQFVVETYGKIDILVNNAGVSFRGKGDRPAADLEEEIWDKTVETNLKGTFLCSKYAIREMLKSGGGSIINTASLGGLRGSPATAYGASKGAIWPFTQSLALIYGKNKIRANAICPGQIYTPMLMSILNTPEKKEQSLRAIPLNRFGEPQDVAYAALFLASDEASFVSGSLLLVDGGQLTRP